MIGWTLGHYFFMRYIKTTLYFLLGIFALAFLMDFTENAGRLASLPSYTPLRGLAISMLRIPFIMQQLFPFIALFSAMATLISLNRAFELIITRSIGVSAWQFLLPACLGAFLLGLAAILIVNPLAAWGAAKSQKIIANWRTGSNFVLAHSNRVPWFTERTDQGTITIGAKRILDNGRVLVNTTFIRFNSNQTIRDWLNAGTAKLGDGSWLLLDGTRYHSGRPPEKFDEIRIATKLKSGFIEQYLADPQTIPFYELPYKIRIARSFGYPTNKFDMHLQSIIALPALLIAMTLIAATVSLKFIRSGQSNMMILNGIIAGFMLYVVNVLMQAFGKAGYVSPLVVAWVPVLIAMLAGISFLLHKEDG
ncbi:MAG: lipopolysaccharide export system permease protein [Candidatus Tokpelaia sp. JSC189]|nr:MAG: lipopolysaccharide export system permease protein [Candidatus Tokpelaia sp. JSC189]